MDNLDQNKRGSGSQSKVKTSKSSINALERYFNKAFWTTVKWMSMICGCAMSGSVIASLFVEAVRTWTSGGTHTFNGWWSLGVGIISYLLFIPFAYFVEKNMIDKTTVLMNAIIAVSEGDLDVKIETNDDDDFNVVYEHFNNMVEEIKLGKNVKSDMANSFSHELKTPLASINGFARMLKNDDLPPEKKKKYLDMIISQSGRLSKLAQDTLTLSRLDAMKIMTDKRVYRLDEQVKNVCIAMEGEWSVKDLELSVDCEEVEYYGNSDIMASVFTNLLNNAIKFTPKNGEISITLKNDGKNARFTISDTGIGMTEEAKARIFERFYQADSSHSGQGSGLGLSIVKQIVDMVGGKIDVISHPDEGTTFVVTLPNSAEEKKNAEKQ